VEEEEEAERRAEFFHLKSSVTVSVYLFRVTGEGWMIPIMLIRYILTRCMVEFEGLALINESWIKRQRLSRT
jgi:hypothetical protein